MQKKWYLEIVRKRKVVGYMRQIYPNIDMKKTGNLLKEKIEQAGYSVKEIQELLMLSCPQPIYRWFNGKVLPSGDHLYALGNILHMHMEDLLIPKEMKKEIINIGSLLGQGKRLYTYWGYFGGAA